MPDGRIDPVMVLAEQGLNIAQSLEQRRQAVATTQMDAETKQIQRLTAQMKMQQAVDERRAKMGLRKQAAERVAINASLVDNAASNGDRFTHLFTFINVENVYPSTGKNAQENGQSLAFLQNMPQYAAWKNAQWGMIRKAHEGFYLDASGNVVENTGGNLKDKRLLSTYELAIRGRDDIELAEKIIKQTAPGARHLAANFMNVFLIPNGEKGDFEVISKGGADAYKATMELVKQEMLNKNISFNMALKRVDSIPREARFFADNAFRGDKNAFEKGMKYVLSIEDNVRKAKQSGGGYLEELRIREEAYSVFGLDYLKGVEIEEIDARLAINAQAEYDRKPFAERKKDRLANEKAQLDIDELSRKNGILGMAAKNARDLSEIRHKKAAAIQNAKSIDIDTIDPTTGFSVGQVTRADSVGDTAKMAYFTQGISDMERIIDEPGGGTPGPGIIQRARDNISMLKGMGLIYRNPPETRMSVASEINKNPETMGVLDVYLKIHGHEKRIRTAMAENDGQKAELEQQLMYKELARLTLMSDDVSAVEDSLDDLNAEESSILQAIADNRRVARAVGETGQLLEPGRGAERSPFEAGRFLVNVFGERRLAETGEVGVLEARRDRLASRLAADDRQANITLKLKMAERQRIEDEINAIDEQILGISRRQTERLERLPVTGQRQPMSENEFIEQFDGLFGSAPTPDEIAEARQKGFIK